MKYDNRLFEKAIIILFFIVDSISPSSTIKMISSTSLVDSPTDAPFSIAPLTIGKLHY